MYNTRLRTYHTHDSDIFGPAGWRRGTEYLSHCLANNLGAVSERAVREYLQSGHVTQHIYAHVKSIHCRSLACVLSAHIPIYREKLHGSSLPSIIVIPLFSRVCVRASAGCPVLVREGRGRLREKIYALARTSAPAAAAAVSPENGREKKSSLTCDNNEGGAEE